MDHGQTLHVHVDDGSIHIADAKHEKDAFLPGRQGNTQYAHVAVYVVHVLANIYRECFLSTRNAVLAVLRGSQIYAAVRHDGPAMQPKIWIHRPCTNLIGFLGGSSSSLKLIEGMMLSSADKSAPGQITTKQVETGPLSLIIRCFCLRFDSNTGQQQGP